MKTSNQGQAFTSLAAVALLLLGLTAVYLTVGDATWWGECLTIWPPLVWCAVLAPRLVLMVVRRAFRELAVVGILIAIFLGTTMEWRELFRKPRAIAASGERNLRVVSWNVAGGMPLDDLSRLTIVPDIAFLQEIGTLDQRALQSGPFKGFHWEGSFDPGVLSRFPLQKLETERVGPWQPPLVLRATLTSDRSLLLVNARLVLPAFVVTIASGESPLRLKEAHAERIQQFRLLATLIAKRAQEEHPTAIILCGDFNTPGGIQSLQPLRAMLRDIWPQAGVGWGGTMTAELPVSRIDQCWVSSNVGALQAAVARGRSDHRMLVADLMLP